jgi:hypothetical protein
MVLAPLIQKILADNPHVEAVWAEPGPDDGSNRPRL